MTDDDRFVGRAGLPHRRYDDPPTLPLETIPPRRRRRWPLGLVAGLVAGAFILLLIGVMTGYAVRFGEVGGGPGAAAPPAASPTPVKPSPTPSPPDTPKAAAERFFTAVIAGDNAVMRQNLCRLLRGEQPASAAPRGDFNWLTLLGGMSNFKVGEEHRVGPAASVDVNAALPLVGDTKFSVYLLQEDGRWRVCGGGPA